MNHKVSASSALHIKVEWTDGAVVMCLSGDAGLVSVDDMEREFRPIVASKPPLLIVDISELRFISSLGLSILVQASRAITRNGGNMRLIKPQPLIRDLITKSKLDTVLPLFATIEEASR
jgi:anti-sigma B factor antagonist